MLIYNDRNPIVNCNNVYNRLYRFWAIQQLERPSSVPFDFNQSHYPANSLVILLDSGVVRYLSTTVYNCPSLSQFGWYETQKALHDALVEIVQLWKKTKNPKRTCPRKKRIKPSVFISFELLLSHCLIISVVVVRCTTR